MDTIAKPAFIHRVIRENSQDPLGRKIAWSRHAITELVAEDLTRTEVEQALLDCEIIEDYPTLHRPLPDCLTLGWLNDVEPIHAVIAIDEILDRILMVTTYRPSPEEWENDWRTRKR